MHAASYRLTATLLLALLALSLPGCVGMVHGLHSRKVLYEEKYLARDPGTGLLLGGEPFFFPGYDNGKAVLLIHGFADTPYDLRPLGEYLAAHGITACAPLLKGHGTSAKDMEKTGWRDWLVKPESALKELSSKHKKVYLAGFSMGGSIAIDLASRYEVAGVILLAPSI